MIGYTYRSLTRRVMGAALRVLLLTLGLALLGYLFKALLVLVAGVSVLVILGAALVRLRLFRWRGW